MNVIDKFRSFTLNEIFILALLKTINLSSRAITYFDDLKKYSMAVRNLISMGYDVYRKTDKIIKISNNEDRYLVRRFGSDLKVFEQIVVGGEYNHILNLIKKTGLGDSELTIVDCGSNIGLFSAWMINQARVKKIISVEADKENYVFNKYFIGEMKYENRIELFHRAIWSDSNSVLGISSEFRDGLQWAKSVVPVLDLDQETVNSISLNKIFDNINDEQVHILKIDIEGAEKVVFENLNSCDRMLKNTRIIALEIHKEVDSTGWILEILQNYGFILEEFGETTFGYKLDIK